MNKGQEHSLGSLTGIFQNFHLDDFRREINLWQAIALCNDQSAYDEGGEREDLIDFIQGLHRLIEAFHVINKKASHKKKSRSPKGLPKTTQQLLSKMDIPVLLSAKEKSRPYLVVKRFCKTFKQGYVHTELLDLLDAVITYTGNKKVYKGNLVLFYQHVHYLVTLAYAINKNEALLQQ